MELEQKNRLMAAGIDVEDALKRMMGSEKLLLRLLKKFLADQNYKQWVQAMETQNREKAIDAAHALKGICGNLSMTELYLLFSKQVDDLRADRWEKAEAQRSYIGTVYERVRNAIMELEA